LQHLGVGIFDLIDKPIEGFVKGPLEGGIGIVKGKNYQKVNFNINKHI
jgi:vacuolar protein sorting-associated protein 13A/C